MERSISRRRIVLSTGSLAAAANAGCLESIRESNYSPTIRVPEETTVGSPCPIDVAGFPSNDEVTVELVVTDGRSRTCTARITVETDSEGEARVDDDALPSDGPGTEMLLWQTRPPSEQTDTEYFVKGDRDAFGVTVWAKGTTGKRVAADLRRTFYDRDVRSQRVSDESLSGILYEPGDSGPHPGVILLHGSGGNIPRELGRLLATNGYTTLALRYFGADGLPPDLANVPLEYFERAIEWLRSHETVTDEVNLVGFSRGGEAALLVASTFELSGTVVSYAGSGLIHNGFPRHDQPAWTLDGEPVAPVSESSVFFGSVPANPPTNEEESVEFYEDLPETVRESVTIPVEDISGPVLLLSGEDDNLWPAPFYSWIASYRLDQHDHDWDFAHSVYDGAGHIIHGPYHSYDQGLTSPRMGGTPQANARAAAHAWPRVLRYLDRGSG